MVGTPPEPLEQGLLSGTYPINDQADPNFNVGGVRRILPDELQLEQLVSYIDSTYPRPADPEALDRYLALLPDRITHAAMLMLGSAVDHAMPGVAYPKDIRVDEVEFGQLFTPSNPSQKWVVSLWPTPGLAREFAWRPEVAAVAQLSGARIVDVDKHEALEPAVDYARRNGATSVAVWIYGEATLPATLTPEGIILTFPQSVDIPNGALVQVPVGTRMSAQDGTVIEYHWCRSISTPAQARRRVRDVAEFLAAL